MRRDTLSAEYAGKIKRGSAMPEPEIFTKSALPFKRIRIVPGKEGQDIAEDSAWDSAQELKTAGFRFDLEDYAKPGIPLFLRMEFEAETPGRYILGLGADWFTVTRLDGKVALDLSGGNVFYPPRIDKHMVPLDLTEGRHVLDIRFIRGTASAVLCACVIPESVLPEVISEADFGKTVRKVNPMLHSSNSAPNIPSRSIQKYDDELRKMNFQLSRTHDWALWNKGQRIIDTHFVFPLMKLDPKDPTNYYFDATDEALRVCQEEAGIGIFYRLGTSIEHTLDRHFNTLVPEDFGKYAEVLAGIVRHYTKGWADGFHYDIQYWEIWNEPNIGPKMWCGEFETFISFFVTVLKRLKSEFPELKIGGPALTCLDLSKTKRLLTACTKAGVKPDFFSWHCYTADPKGLVVQAGIARELLDKAGFPDTELCINEWHYLESWEGFHSKITPETFRRSQKATHGIDSAAFNIAVLSGWQYTLLDTAFYYGSRWEGTLGYITPDQQLDKNFYSLCLMGDMIRDYTELCPVRNSNTISLMAAKSEDEKSAALLVSDFQGELKNISVCIHGLETAEIERVVRLDEKSDNVPTSAQWDGKKLRMEKEADGSAVFMVLFRL